MVRRDLVEQDYKRIFNARVHNHAAQSSMFMGSPSTMSFTVLVESDSV